MEGCLVTESIVKSRIQVHSSDPFVSVQIILVRSRTHYVGGEVFLKYFKKFKKTAPVCS